MKRYKTLPGDPGVTLFDAICDPENIVRAHINASKGKSWYKEIIMVNSNPQYYLGEVRRMLVEQTYVNSSYEEFDREENGKMRHIYKLPYYPDRIIQWAILQVIGQINLISSPMFILLMVILFLNTSARKIDIRTLPLSKLSFGQPQFSIVYPVYTAGP